MSPALKKPKDALVLRLISASIMIPAGILVVWLGGGVLMAAGAICSLFMWHEFWTVTTGKRPDVWMVLIGLLMVFSLLAAHAFNASASVSLLVMSVLIAVLVFVGHKPFKVWLIGGAILITGAVHGLLLLRGDSSAGLFLTFVVMAGVWITDIAAYFAGRGFGGPKLAPKNSPNKTWSGATGAMICTALVGALFAGLIGGPVLPWMFLAGLVSVVAQFGDLCESQWKRRFGVKDSGQLIPGHGGILDRLDSLSGVLIFWGAVLMLMPDFPERLLDLGTL